MSETKYLPWGKETDSTNLADARQEALDSGGFIAPLWKLMEHFPLGSFAWTDPNLEAQNLPYKQHSRAYAANTEEIVGCAKANTRFGKGGAELTLWN